MERQKREISVEEEEEEDSEDELTLGDDSDEDEGKEYCYGSVPASNSQPRKVLSKARWVSEVGMAEVELRKGSIWTTTGIVRRGKLYCSIEEVLFLVELGALVLMDDTGTCIEDVYTKLSAENGCCWDYFHAYRHLKSLGYIVGRHGIPWSLKSVSGSSESSNLKCSVENVDDLKSEDDIGVTEMLSQMQIGEARPVFDVYRPNSKFKKSCPGDPSFVICFTRGYPPSKETVEILDRQCGGLPLKFCHVEQAKVSFFSFEKLDLSVLP